MRHIRRAPGLLACFVVMVVALSHADSMSWSQNYGPAYNSIPNNSYATSSSGVVTAEVTFAGGGDGERLDQDNGWWGNFSPGDALLWTNSPGQGPLTLTFSVPLTAISTDIQADALGPETATLTLFDSQGQLVASFSVDGVSNGNDDGSALSIGLANVSPFTSAQFSLSNCCDNGDFSINTVNFTPTPEPASLLMFASGLGLGLLFYRRWL